MGNVEVRLPDELEQALEALAAELDTNRSAVVSTALSEGLRAMRLERGLTKFTAGELSLEAAAGYAGVSISQMARGAAERGIAYHRYDPAEAEADRAAALELLADEESGDEGGRDPQRS